MGLTRAQQPVNPILGNPSGTLGCICWAVLTAWYSHPEFVFALPVFEARQWHKGQVQDGAQALRMGTAEGRLFEGVLGHAAYTRCGLQQSQTSSEPVSPLRTCLEETCQLIFKTAVEHKIQLIYF